MVIKIVKSNPGAVLPQYGSEYAAGMDLCAFLTRDVSIPSSGRVKIPTGISVEIPPGFEGQVRPRSGLALRQGLTVLNAPGTIDSDYRGPLEVILINLGAETVTIHNGDRIAQLVIAPVVTALIEEAGSLTETKRGSGGFGSTGV